MARVLLVNTNTERSPYPVPPVGLCILANILSASHEVKLYDGHNGNGASMLQLIEQFDPQYIGFSIRNIDNLVCHNSRFFLDDIRTEFIEPVRHLNSIVTIGGGSGFSVMPVELMTFFGFDYGLVGEAEHSFPMLLDAISQGADPGSVPGLILPGQKNFNKNRGSWTSGASGKPFSRIYDFIDFGPYLQRGAYPVQTKRGCMHECLYCTYPVIEGRSFRERIAAEVVDEIEDAQQKLGDVLFEIVDSTFNDPPGHAEMICREIIGRSLKVRIRTMGINPANASPELFSLMRKAGFTQIDSTPDSASPVVLKALKKNFTLQQLQDTGRFLKESGLPVMWFFMFGGPGETEETIAETFDFIDEFVCRDDMVHISAGLRIFPDTGLCEVAKHEGVITEDESLLRPVFYFAPGMPQEKLFQILKEKSLTRSNCILSTESTPSPEMMKRAMDIRLQENLTEPMFRTLMRVRREDLSGKSEK